MSKHSNKQVLMKDFYLGYRKVDLNPSEILKSIFVPFLTENEYAHSYKQAKRKEDDIAIVNASFRVKLDCNGYVLDTSLVFGGMGIF